MKEFLKNKNNVAFSAYITDKTPAAITTNGALTIIDNSTPDDNNKYINGLVPNSYSIFLDNLFLASGHGFSSYSQYNTASYIINSYNDVFSYLKDEIDKIQNQSFNLEYSYELSENKIDKMYNSYGWLTEYKKIDIEKSETDLSTHTIVLTTIHNSYINNINIEVIGDEYVEPNTNVTVKLSFIKNNYLFNSGTEPYIDNAPDIYFNDEKIDLSNASTNANSLYITRNFELNEYSNLDLSLVCKRDTNVMYSYTFNNAVKCRYKVLPFNTEILNAFIYLDINTFYALDFYNFSDLNFNIDNISSNIISSFFNFIDTNFENNAVYLDDALEIEYLGTGFNIDNSLVFSHDYLVVKNESINLNYYLSEIKNNSWNYIEFTQNGQLKYRLYQSPQRYIGKHTWKIKYNYE